MRITAQLTALAWKEWHEVRAFLWIGLGVLLGLPVIAGIEFTIHYSQRFQIETIQWVVTFGGVLAVLVGAGSACRDFSGRLEDFWRSRAVSTTSWLAVKFVVGLFVVVAACEIPLLAELALDRDKGAARYAEWFPFLWGATYGVGFFCGCLLRRTAHATLFGLAGLLLIYFAPVVLRPLNWLNTQTVIEFANNFRVREFAEVEFAAGMFGLTVIFMLLSLIAVWRDWRIESGRKTMATTVLGVFLVLLGSVGFKMGTNLPVLQQIDLPKGEEAQIIRCDGPKGFMVTQQQVFGRFVAGDYFYERMKFLYRSIRLDSAGIELGQAREISQPNDGLNLYYAGTYHPQHPEIDYYAEEYNEKDEKYVDLYVHALDSGRSPIRLNLWKAKATDEYPGVSDLVVRIWHSQLHVFGASHLFALDISNPLWPRLTSVTPFELSWPFDPNIAWHDPIPDRFDARMFPFPGLSAEERLDATMQCFFDRDVFSGRVLCLKTGQSGVAAYYLTQLTDQSARFQKIGEFEPSMLDRMFGELGLNGNSGRLTVEGGLLYDSDRSWRSALNSRITVFDLSQLGTLQPAGHFAAVGAEVVCPLPDGRALVGGTKLYLIGPPPGYEAKGEKRVPWLN